ncbi:MAG: hypothetical protein ACK5NQ_16530 [Pseudomonas sp.]
MYRIGLLFFSITAVAGCAGSLAEPQSLDCVALNKVVDAASEDFKSISRQREITHYGEVKEVKLHAYGKCSVLSTAGKPAVYVCSSKSLNQQADRALLVDAAERCLGQGWERSELPGGGASFIQNAVKVSVGKTDRQAAHDSSVGLAVRRY